MQDALLMEVGIAGPATDPTELSVLNLRAIPRSVPAARGWGWIKDGFDYFRQRPLQWIAAMFVGLLIMTVLSIVPLLGQLVLTLSTYVWLGGLMLGCEAQSLGDDFEVRHLFSAISSDLGRLVVLSLLYTVATVGILLIIVAPILMGLMDGAPPTPELAARMADPVSFLVRGLVGMLFNVPLMMALWFAPALIVINYMTVFAAMKLSFWGCLGNIRPFVVYGLIVFVLYIIAAIPFFVGLPVLFPTLIASIHAAYRDIFVEATA